MPTSETDVLKAKDAQRAQAKRATFASLKNKKAAQSEFSMALGEDGEQLSFLFRAVGATAYDALLDKCSPTKEQIAQGMSYDQNKFAPKLLAAVCQEPVMDEEEWRLIWQSDEWSRGEVAELFGRAVNLCNREPDITPIAAG